jgi:hypothetical protein
MTRRIVFERERERRTLRSIVKEMRRGEEEGRREKKFKQQITSKKKTPPKDEKP